ncbi:L-aspartate oxidase [Deinococcus aquiradiocola]|uniref:L-aspartate oxidase n=1 Tax=Deinococcus aquiradiocola TaxID=393059 RepID=UPI00166D8480|nr:L-aspartate oxidase [Deinococcus aquiradiocola]
MFTSSFDADLLIVGGGIAGLSAALHAHRRGLRVLLVSKTALEGGSTFWAQGGAAAPTGPDDHAAHLHDTLDAGRGLCHEDVVAGFVQEAAASLDALDTLGVPFSRHVTLEGGHGRPRVRHAYGDETGRAISETLARAVRQSGMQVLEHTFARRLLQSASGRVVGAELETQGRVTQALAGAVLLATGGFGRVYPVTTAPPEGTGDGLALAYRAGAELRDLEFVQFHPTAFVPATPPGTVVLVSEAVRGEGAHLLNGDGERFMARHDAALELAPRDVVARAVAAERARTGTVTLDLRHLGADHVRTRFPGIAARLTALGVDPATTPVPVQPAVHYTMGGVTTDAWGRTTLPGLYAAGEVASSGLHGANRLASNSLTEGLVFGARAVQAAAQDLHREPPARATPLQTLPEGEWLTAQARLADAAGLVRHGDALQAALDGWPDLPDAPDSVDRAALERGNLALLGRLLLLGALARQESRGAHWRADHPHLAAPRHAVQVAGTLRHEALPGSVPDGVLQSARVSTGPTHINPPESA